MLILCDPSRISNAYRFTQFERLIARKNSTMFTLRLVASIAVLLVLRSTAVGEEVSRASKPVRIGAVAYAPSAVTIFNGIKTYLNRHGLASDYVLYSNYGSLADALVRGEIDVAWNTPLAHAQCHLRLGERSQTLVMRDVDRGFRSVLVARTDRPVKTLKDLPGRTLVMGSREAAEATVLPKHYLKQAGVDFTKLTILDLDKEVDFEGNPCSSEQDVLKALRDGRADAGIIGERLWKAVEHDQQNEDDGLRLVWTSPAFNHCVFTAGPSFDPKLGDQFRSLMLAMSAEEPGCADVLRLEGTRQWIAGTHEGFEDLIEALRESEQAATPTAGSSQSRK
jgi:phosphonate transport system substrate-binding protein